MDLLQSLIDPQSSQGGGASFGQTQGAIAPGQSAAPGGQTSTPLAEVVVQAKKRMAPPAQSVAPPANPGPLAAPPNIGTPQVDPGVPDQTPQPPGINYDNSGAAQAVNSAISGEHPRGGMANSGVYGLLPQGLQHGTMRNILGALGDALLVSGGRQPAYEERMQRQELGQAMAGMDINDPSSVAAASQRALATGATGGADIYDKSTALAEQARLRQQYMEYNNTYRTGMLGVRQEAQQAQAAGIADRYRPQIGGMLSGIKDPAIYAQKYQSLAPLAKQIGGPLATPASLWSIPEPGAWTPDLTGTYGMTSNNIQQASDRSAQRNVSMRNADVNAGARVQAAGISASRPSATTEIQGLEQAETDGSATPAQTARFNYLTTHATGRAPRPLLNTGGGGTAPPAVPASTNRNAAVSYQGGVPVFTVEQARAHATPGNSGKHFYIQGQPGLQVFH